MKTITKMLLLSGLIIGMMACKKSETTEPETSNNNSTTSKVFYCKINGVEYTATTANYIKLNGTALAFQINAEDSKQSIELRLNSVDANTYVFNDSTIYGTVYVFATSKEYKDGNGQVKITKSENDKITGTFSYTAFNGNDSLVITEGEFNSLPKK